MSDDNGISRRQFVGAMGVAAAALALPAKSGMGPAARADVPSPDPDKDFTIRAISYNVEYTLGHPRKDVNEWRRQRIHPQLPVRTGLELNIYQPNIVSLQECPPERRIREVAETMEMDHVWFPGGWPGAILTHIRYSIQPIVRLMG